MTASEIAFETTLRASARRAYEIGRAEGALCRGALAALVAVPAYAMCGQTHPVLAGLCVGGLALVVFAGRIRGSAWEEGSRAGAFAGVAPCLLPAAIRYADPAFCAATVARIPWPCAVGGLAAGFVLGFRGPRAAGTAVPFWVSAGAALTFAAALGCLPVGALGFAGLLAGIVAGGAPALVLRRAIE